MRWFLRNPIFYTILACMVGAACGGVWLTTKDRAALEALKAGYFDKSRQLDTLVMLSPAPTQGNLDALEANYVALYRQYQTAQAAMNLNTFDSEKFFGSPPPSHNDAFFEIARYVDEVRSLANKNKVAYSSGYRFGFRAYANEGPDLDRLPHVHRQVKILRVLLDWLLESGVTEIVSVEREPFEKSQPAGNQPKGDYFLLDPPSSARIPDVIDSLGFRMKFNGQTRGLRNFLSHVMDSDLPFAINGIEVLYAADADTAVRRNVSAQNPFFGSDGGRSLVDGAQVPIISENESLFVVTLEFLRATAKFEKPQGYVSEEAESPDA